MAAMPLSAPAAFASCESSIARRQHLLFRFRHLTQETVSARIMACVVFQGIAPAGIAKYRRDDADVYSPARAPSPTGLSGRRRQNFDDDA